ncbi:MAG TPA: hypothetical protein VHS28_06785 [Chloroflexota bacterium]|nr:hypothetical protein [Chloroflexota bacterium]
MPVYDYVCPECGNREERRVTIEMRDEQRCYRQLPVAGSLSYRYCSTTMERQCHYGSLVLSVPASFSVCDSQMSEPLTPEVKRYWDEIGVHRADFREI